MYIMLVVKWVLLMLAVYWKICEYRMLWILNTCIKYLKGILFVLEYC